MCRTVNILAGEKNQITFLSVALFSYTSCLYNIPQHFISYAPLLKGKIPVFTREPIWTWRENLPITCYFQTRFNLHEVFLVHFHSFGGEGKKQVRVSNWPRANKGFLDVGTPRFSHHWKALACSVQSTTVWKLFSFPQAYNLNSIPVVQGIA